MSGWIFATGRQHETALPGALSPGATSTPLTDANTLFAAGDLLFASATPGGGGAPATQLLWLGRITAATSTTLSFSRPLPLALASGAHVWRAAAWIELPGPGQWYGPAHFGAGVHQAVALADAYFSVQLGARDERATLRLERIPAALFGAWHTWFLTALAAGAEPFTLLSPQLRSFLVRIAPAPSATQGRLFVQWQVLAGTLFQLDVTLRILGEEQYA